MNRFARSLPTCALGIALFSGVIAGCSAPVRPDAIEMHSPGKKPAVPADIAAVATAALGSNAKVLLFGNLAQNGRRQVLAANGTGATSKADALQITRAAVLEQAGTKWVEVLRCDEYLKNPAGYLAGTPRQPVTSWRLEFGGKSKDHSQDLMFTPLAISGAAQAPMPTVSVRWNSSARRYQSMDPKSGHFLEEASLLETPVSPLR